jgi:predicted P-loop ATPase
LPDLSSVPAELRGLRRWLLWKYVQRDGRWTKLPLKADGSAASSTDPSSWTDLESALQAARRMRCGVGIALGRLDDGMFLCAIDLDGAFDNDGNLQEWSQRIVDRFQSTYIERSVSGKGVHIVGLCSGLPGSRCRDGSIEIYLDRRFIVWTGDRLTPPHLADISEELRQLYIETFGSEPEPSPQPVATLPVPPLDLDGNDGNDELTDEDIELLDRAMNAKNGAKFRAVFFGNWQPYYKSQSEADLGLLNMLRFWTRGNQEQMDRIYRHSRLFRDKWQDRDDYRSRTILKALEGPVMQPKIEVIRNDSWTGKLMVSKTGPRAVLRNALLALRNAPELKGVAGYDRFRCETYMMKPAPWSKDSEQLPRPWTQVDDMLLTDWLQERGIFVGPEVAGQAVEVAAHENEFDSLLDYLNSLQWDGVPRLDTWAADYLQADDDKYTRAVASRWLISAIARAYHPGSKCDSVLVAEGKQGLKKSTAFSILGGEFFSDEISDVGSKDASLQVAGVWVLEVSELDSFARREMSSIKAFLSRQIDRFRPPYGKRPISVPRRCVFCGSTNDADWMRDPSGGRRFWPIRCHGEARVDELAKVRDQLWAEALHRYRQGASWWLDDPALVEMAEEQQAARYESDPWEARILSWAAARGDVSVSEVLEQCIEKPTGQWTKLDRNRVAATLRSAGWVMYRARHADGSREWRFRRFVAKEHDGHVHK